MIFLKNCFKIIYVVEKRQGPEQLEIDALISLETSRFYSPFHNYERIEKKNILFSKRLVIKRYIWDGSISANCIQMAQPLIATIESKAIFLVESISFYFRILYTGMTMI